MKCRNWIERLPSLLDEDPRSPGRRELEAHIGQCERCRGQWSLLTRIKAAAGQMDGLEPGDGVWEGIKEEISDREPEKAGAEVRRGPMVRLAWAAPLTAALVLAIWLWPRPAGKIDPSAGMAGPGETDAVVTAAPPATDPTPTPNVLASPRPPARRERPLAREPRYLMDDLAQAEDLAEPEPRIQYMLPITATYDLADGGSGQQYVMPAVHAAVREPF